MGPTNKRGARIKVTMAGLSTVVAYSYGSSSEHEQAVRDAWEFFRFGTLTGVTYVAESESGNGSVYVVTYEATP
jgi:hypothetical protein